MKTPPLTSTPPRTLIILASSWHWCTISSSQSASLENNDLVRGRLYSPKKDVLVLVLLLSSSKEVEERERESIKEEELVLPSTWSWLIRPAIDTHNLSLVHAIYFSSKRLHSEREAQKSDITAGGKARIDRQVLWCVFVALGTQKSCGALQQLLHR